MLDRQFHAELDRKLNAFRTIATSSLKAETPADGQHALIQTAYDALGEFLRRAMEGTVVTDLVTGETSIKNDGDGSAWGSIRPASEPTMVFDAVTQKSDGSAWGSIRPNRSSGLTR
jgi:hypothetical protein